MVKRGRTPARPVDASPIHPMTTRSRKARTPTPTPALEPAVTLPVSGPAMESMSQDVPVQASNVLADENTAYGSPQAHAPGAKARGTKSPRLTRILAKSIHVSKVTDVADVAEAADVATTAADDEAAGTDVATPQGNGDADSSNEEAIQAQLITQMRTESAAVPHLSSATGGNGPVGGQRTPKLRTSSAPPDDGSSMASVHRNIQARLEAAEASRGNNRTYVSSTPAPDLPLDPTAPTAPTAPTQPTHSTRTTRTAPGTDGLDIKGFWRYLLAVLAIIFILSNGLVLRSTRDLFYSKMGDRIAEVENVQEAHGLRFERHDSRIKNLEEGIRTISLRTGLQHESIRRLEETLPLNIIVSANPDGDYDIDPRFWFALRERIRKDYEEHPEHIVPATLDNKWQTEMAEVKQHVARLGSSWESHWEHWVKSNEDRIQKYIQQTMESAWKGQKAHIARENVLVTRLEFIERLQAEYVRVQRMVQELDHKVTGRIQNEIAARYNAIARAEVVKNYRPNELATFAESAIISNMVQAMNSVNWLTPGLGAVIDPHGTSATYSNDSRPRNAWERFTMLFFGAGSNAFAPEAALEPWLDLDQCWCTSPKYDDPRISVMPARKIYPTEFTIEFPPAGSTPDAGTAPRLMELWVRITDRAAFESVGDEMRAHQYPYDESLYQARRGWLPVGRYTYDTRKANHIQTFPLMTNLVDHRARVDEVTLRFLDNWGDQDRTCLYRLRLHGEQADQSEGIWPEDNTSSSLLSLFSWLWV